MNCLTRTHGKFRTAREHFEKNVLFVQNLAMFFRVRVYLYKRGIARHASLAGPMTAIEVRLPQTSNQSRSTIAQISVQNGGPHNTATIDTWWRIMRQSHHFSVLRHIV